MFSLATWLFTSLLTMLDSCLREGIVRPSAVDMKHPEWHGTATFYVRAVPLSSFSQSSYSDKLPEVIKRASKHTNFQAVRSTSLLLHWVSRQASHQVVKAAGVQADHAASLYHDVIHSHIHNVTNAGRSERIWRI